MERLLCSPVEFLSNVNDGLISIFFFDKTAKGILRLIPQKFIVGLFNLTQLPCRKSVKIFYFSWYKTGEENSVAATNIIYEQQNKL